MWQYGRVGWWVAKTLRWKGYQQALVKELNNSRMRSDQLQSFNTEILCDCLVAALRMTRRCWSMSTWKITALILFYLVSYFNIMQQAPTKLSVFLCKVWLWHIVGKYLCSIHCHLWSKTVCRRSKEILTRLANALQHYMWNSQRASLSPPWLQTKNYP